MESFRAWTKAVAKVAIVAVLAGVILYECLPGDDGHEGEVDFGPRAAELEVSAAEDLKPGEESESQQEDAGNEGPIPELGAPTGEKVDVLPPLPPIWRAGQETGQERPSELPPQILPLHPSDVPPRPINVAPPDNKAPDYRLPDLPPTDKNVPDTKAIAASLTSALQQLCWFYSLQPFATQTAHTAARPSAPPPIGIAIPEPSEFPTGAPPSTLPARFEQPSGAAPAPALPTAPSLPELPALPEPKVPRLEPAPLSPDPTLPLPEPRPQLPAEPLASQPPPEPKVQPLDEKKGVPAPASKKERGDAAEELPRTLRLQPPSAQELFRLDSEASLRERLRQEQRSDPLAGMLDLPEDKPVTAGTKRPLQHLTPHFLVVEPHYVCCKRLFFEQKKAERCGQSCGVLDPVVLTGVFYGKLAVFPVLCLACPWHCFECHADGYSPYFSTLQSRELEPRNLGTHE